MILRDSKRFMMRRGVLHFLIICLIYSLFQIAAARIPVIELLSRYERWIPEKGSVQHAFISHEQTFITLTSNVLGSQGIARAKIVTPLPEHAQEDRHITFRSCIGGTHDDTHYVEIKLIGESNNTSHKVVLYQSMLRRSQLFKYLTIIQQQDTIVLDPHIQTLTIQIEAKGTALKNIALVGCLSLTTELAHAHIVHKSSLVTPPRPPEALPQTEHTSKSHYVPPPAPRHITPNFRGTCTVHASKSIFDAAALTSEAPSDRCVTMYVDHPESPSCQAFLDLKEQTADTVIRELYPSLEAVSEKLLMGTLEDMELPDRFTLCFGRDDEFELERTMNIPCISSQSYHCSANISLLANVETVVSATKIYGLNNMIHEPPSPGEHMCFSLQLVGPGNWSESITIMSPKDVLMSLYPDFEELLGTAENVVLSRESDSKIKICFMLASNVELHSPSTLTLMIDVDALSDDICTKCGLVINDTSASLVFVPHVTTTNAMFSRALGVGSAVNLMGLNASLTSEKSKCLVLRLDNDLVWNVNVEEDGPMLVDALYPSLKGLLPDVVSNSYIESFERNELNLCIGLQALNSSSSFDVSAVSSIANSEFVNPTHDIVPESNARLRIQLNLAEFLSLHTKISRIVSLLGFIHPVSFVGLSALEVAAAPRCQHVEFSEVSKGSMWVLSPLAAILPNLGSLSFEHNALIWNMILAVILIILYTSLVCLWCCGTHGTGASILVGCITSPLLSWFYFVITFFVYRAWFASGVSLMLILTIPVFLAVSIGLLIGVIFWTTVKMPDNVKWLINLTPIFLTPLGMWCPIERVRIYGVFFYEYQGTWPRGKCIVLVALHLIALFGAMNFAGSCHAQLILISICLITLALWYFLACPTRWMILSILRGIIFLILGVLVLLGFATTIHSALAEIFILVLALCILEGILMWILTLREIFSLSRILEQNELPAGYDEKFGGGAMVLNRNSSRLIEQNSGFRPGSLTSPKENVTKISIFPSLTSLPNSARQSVCSNASDTTIPLAEKDISYRIDAIRRSVQQPTDSLFISNGPLSSRASSSSAVYLSSRSPRHQTISDNVQISILDGANSQQRSSTIERRSATSTVSTGLDNIEEDENWNQLLADISTVDGETNTNPLLPSMAPRSSTVTTTTTTTLNRMSSMRPDNLSRKTSKNSINQKTESIDSNSNNVSKVESADLFKWL